MAEPVRGGVVAMSLAPKLTESGESQPPWVGFVKFLLLAILFILIFLLGHTMVNHRFFRGGWVNQRGVLSP
jgi:hypothetical protein